MDPGFGSGLPSAEDLQRSPMLSIQHQRAWRDLASAIGSTQQAVTLVVGAGVSMDAGLPSWPGLIERIATQSLTDPEDAKLRTRLLAEESDIVRKTESIIELSLHRANRSRASDDVQCETSDLLRDALYPDSATPQALLARAVVGLIKALGSNVRLITTNFDDILEKALEEDLSQIPVSSLTLEDVDPEDLDSWASRDGVTLLHVHGYVPGQGEAKGPVVLAESQFLEYGDQVRRLISHALQSTLVIFVGVSINDPNLTGPLWETRPLRNFEPAAAPPGSPPQPFVLIVPDRPPRGVKRSEIADDRSFMLAKSHYLHDKLGLSPIFLKSYSALTQAIWELSVARAAGGNYLGLPKIRYGNRLEQVLEAAYGDLGCSATSDSVVGPLSSQIMAQLSSGLRGEDGNGAIVKWLNDEADEVRRAMVREGAPREVAEEALPRGEDFGVYLWLRARARNSASGDGYQLALVGSSEVSHRSSLTNANPQDIALGSTYPAVECAYVGSRIFREVGDIDFRHVWRGMFAIPIYCTHVLEQFGGFEVPMQIGVITINTQRSVNGDRAPARASGSSADDQKSVLWHLSDERTVELSSMLETLALDILGLSGD